MLHRALPLAALALALSSGACDAPTAELVAPHSSLAAHDVGGAPAPIRLLSRNLYLGADIDHVLQDPVAGGPIAWAEIQHTSYPERAVQLAAEIIGRQPHLVGLQEVSRYEVLNPVTGEPVPGMTLDFLDVLQAALMALGGEYLVVERAANFQATIPVGGILLRYTDGDAVVARTDVEIHDSGWRHFRPENQVDLSAHLPGLGLNLRGFQWADVTVDGRRFLFVNTHLEVQRWAAEQERQTAELLEFVGAREGLVFMVGDFNSAANPGASAASRTASYGMILDAGFEDLWLRGGRRGPEDGLTCCQLSDLSNPKPRLNQRIDFIFGRNVPSRREYAGGAALEVFGAEPADRFQTAAGHDLWPSDHAGLFGELWPAPGLVVR